MNPPPIPPVGAVTRWMIRLACWLLVIVPALAAPYPEDGLPTKWIQPDGTRLTLRVFGDEFYARTATADGYTVIFDPAAKTYFYAVKAEDGESLIASKVSADKAPPADLPKHLAESPKIAAAKRAERTGNLATDPNAAWAARKKAIQAARARQAEAAAGDPSRTPVSPTK